MLRKLMKYDLKYYLRIMLPLWIVLIIYGIIWTMHLIYVIRYWLIIFVFVNGR